MIDRQNNEIFEYNSIKLKTICHKSSYCVNCEFNAVESFRHFHCYISNKHRKFIGKNCYNNLFNQIFKRIYE